MTAPISRPASAPEFEEYIGYMFEEEPLQQAVEPNNGYPDDAPVQGANQHSIVVDTYDPGTI